MNNELFKINVDEKTGLITEIINCNDSFKMNWCSDLIQWGKINVCNRIKTEYHDRLFQDLTVKEVIINYDNSSAISLGKIDWSEMERVYIKGGFLNIKLINPEPYLRKKNWLQMLMIKGNYKLGYGDVCISPERFKKEAESFIDEFSKRRAIDQ